MRAAALLLACGAAAAPNPPPAIEVEGEGCARPGHRPLACALVVDDTAVARVRAVFRAGGSAPYYWTAMAFDGTVYCAWLPQPLPGVTTVELYVEAFDDAYESSRSRDLAIVVKEDCAPAEGRAPSGAAVVGTTRAGQPPSPAGFEPATFRLRGAAPP